MNKEELFEVLREGDWGGHGVITREGVTPKERGWTNTIKGVYHHLRYEENEGDKVLSVIHETVLPEEQETFETTGRYSSVKELKTLDEIRALGVYDGVKV